MTRPVIDDALLASYRGSRATFGMYTVSVNVCGGQVCETISQPFVVTHADNPSAAGGFRRRMLREGPKLACARERGFDVSRNRSCDCK
jgi:hypothetical protein